MPPPARIGSSLDVAEDHRFQQGEWRVERAGWVAMALVVAAARAGEVRSVCASLKGRRLETVLRGLAVYALRLIVFRIAGKRTLSQVTTFNFVLLLIIAEATQQALLGQDYWVTGAFVLVATLLGADIGLSLLKRGELLRDRMAKARIDRTTS